MASNPFKNASEKLNALNDALSPNGNAKDNIGKVPYYSTGARAFIKIGGKPLGVCQDFRWTVSYQPNTVYTIDTVFPWDIEVGPATINATLSQILDPTKGPEADNLLPTMQSSVHQPLVELQVLDALGTSLFFARGMFLSVNGSIQKGQLSQITANFTGVAYQHYVAQSFKPYGIAGTASKIVGEVSRVFGKLTGGIL